MREKEWTTFFREYAAASQSNDAERIAGFYADGFLVAGPTGASAFKNDKEFREWLEGLFKFNEQSGMESLDVAGVQPSLIDERYALVAVDWVARFRKSGEEQIPFRISYIVSLLDGKQPKIAGYISREDQQELMKSKGLL